MKEFQEKVRELKSTWDNVEKAMSLAPEAWKPYLLYTSQAEISEVISIAILLLDRSKALPGFKPTYRVAKGFAITALENALVSAKNLANSQWANFPTFLTSLNQLLSAFHTMFLFSDKDESRRLVEELGGKLSESLALIDTAQKELSTKKELLETTQKIIDEAQEKAKNVIEYESESKTKLELLSNSKTEADNTVSAIKENETTINELIDTLNSEVEKNEKLQLDLDEQKKQLMLLHGECLNIRNLIKELLPDAASAGLAASFSNRVKQMEKAKWAWMGSFIASIIGLIVVGIFIFEKLHLPQSEFWQVVLQKLPFTAPFIWLGWFSAIQYGNTIRVQEDYAFKEATSKAFVGYKDHMEHLSNINVEDTKTAMKLLATKTIEILAREPLRIYQKAEHDASPFKSFFSGNKKEQKPDKENE
jgi:hypothetical protein